MNFNLRLPLLSLIWLPVQYMPWDPSLRELRADAYLALGNVPHAISDIRNIQPSCLILSNVAQDTGRTGYPASNFTVYLIFSQMLNFSSIKIHLSSYCTVFFLLVKYSQLLHPAKETSVTVFLLQPFYRNLKSSNVIFKPKCLSSC